MKYKKWVITKISIILCILISICSINYYIDPLWLFTSDNMHNKFQDGFDERQQKTNKITFQKFEYDSLIIGSSRTTFINPINLQNTKTYNYSSSSMDPEEYNDYIEYAKKKRGKEFEYIFLGLDFFGTNQVKKLPKSKEPKFYINQSNELFYRCKSLLSLDTLKYSLINIRLSINQDKTRPVYNRKGIKDTEIVTKEKKEYNIKNQLKLYHEDVYSNYKYKNMKKIFQELKINNPNTTFVVFTTPVSESLFNLMVKDNRLEDYKHWIRDSVEVFGDIYNFMYLNSITRNKDNYVDAHHFKPDIGKIIAYRITNPRSDLIPKDFGKHINRNNIEQHLKNIERDL